MLSWFVHGFQKANQLTPDYILVLFIVSVLAAVWAIATLLAYHRTRHSAIFVSFIDLCFVGALIGGVVTLRGIARANCAHFGRDDDSHGIYGSLGPFVNIGGSFNGFSFNVNKPCAMLKAAFAFGIMNIIFFAITSVLALFIHRRNHDVVVKETHVRRHGHRRTGSHGSRHSRGSPRRRQYYV